MAKYRLDLNGMVVRLSDLTHIPPDSANRDRQEYDKWVADGGGADPYIVPVMDNWEIAMAQSDMWMPRTMEDILDGMPNKLSVPQITLDRLQAKKDLRATKP